MQCFGITRTFSISGTVTCAVTRVASLVTTSGCSRKVVFPDMLVWPQKGSLAAWPSFKDSRCVSAAKCPTSSRCCLGASFLLYILTCFFFFPPQFIAKNGLRVHFLKGEEGFIGVRTCGLLGSELKTYTVSAGCWYTKIPWLGFGGLKRGILCYLFCSAGSCQATSYPLGREKASLVIPASLKETSKIP